MGERSSKPRSPWLRYCASVCCIAYRARHFCNFFHGSIVFSECTRMFQEKINIMEKFVQIKSRPLHPFPKQQWVSPYKVGLCGDSLNQETQVLSTTCVRGHFCNLELAELLSFSLNSKEISQFFKQTRNHNF